MEIRPNRVRFWTPWRRRFPRLAVIVAAAFMGTLLLLAVDWTPLRAHHLEWLLYIAWFLLTVLWAGTAFVVVALVLLIAAVRVERIVLDEGRVRRHLVFGRRMEVAVEGAVLTRRKGLDVVRAASTGERLQAPHLYYAPEDLDRLWAAAGLTLSSDQL